MKKKISIGLCALLVLALLIPVPMTLKDGGTRVYQAILYRVEQIHQLGPEGGPEYLDGTVVRVLGMEVFNSVKTPEDSQPEAPRDMPPTDTTNHAHLPAETDGTLDHEAAGYCGNTVTTVSYGALLPGEEAWEVTFWGDDSVTLTDLLRYLDYSGDCCDCLPEYTVNTEFGSDYGINLTESYVRHGDGQAALTAEQTEQIRDILERQKEQA